MQGAFEIGPGGLKGDVEGDLFRGIIQKGLESGMPVDEAVELAAGATGPTAPALRSGPTGARGPTGATGATMPTGTTGARDPTSEWLIWNAEWAPRSLEATRQRLIDHMTTQIVGQQVLLDRDVSAIVERVAAEKKWGVQGGARIQREGRGSSRSWTFDYVLDTAEGPIVLETAILQTPESIVAKSNAVASTVRELHPLAAFIVVPNGGVSGHPKGEGEVEIIEVGRLEQRLREFPGND
jgi:hypothetical protein